MSSHQARVLEIFRYPITVSFLPSEGDINYYTNLILKNLEVLGRILSDDHVQTFHPVVFIGSQI